MKALLITLFSLFPCTTWALDCSPPTPVTDIRLYIGSIHDLDDQIVPGQDLPTVETCAIGNVANAIVEQQWLDVETAWKEYETAALKVLKPPAISQSAFPSLKVESFNIGKIVFVNLGRDYRDLSEAASSIADIISFTTRRESKGGNGTVMRYDILQWTSNPVSSRLVIVYDDSQVLTVEVNAWREACRSQIFTMKQIEEVEYPDHQLAVEGMEDICSITLQELAPAQSRE